MTESIRIATWNLMWRSPNSAAAPVIRRRLNEASPDIAVLTEARLAMLEDLDGLASEMEHAGLAVYPGTPADGAKVAIVSKHPLKVFGRCEDTALPKGNFLAVDVETASGPLRVIGIVVRYNQINDYISALPAALERTVTDRTVLAGDFNLRIPDARPASRRLEAVLKEFRLSIRTQGDHDALAGERPLIDHIAVSEGLDTSDLEVWPRRADDFSDGTKEVTDHAGSALTVLP